MPHERSGGAVVVGPLVGETTVLLVEESTKPNPKYLKFMSERFKSGDTVLDAIVRGMAQEYGLKDLVVKLDSAGIRPQVKGIIDPRILDCKQLAEPEELISKKPPHQTYTRYFWGIRTVDSVIKSLSGQTLITPGEREILRTQWYYLGALNKLNLLPEHRALVERLLEPQPT